MSVGYCADRINSNTPNGTMKVAVAGLLRTADSETTWKLLQSPVGKWFQWIANLVQGKRGPGETPWADLPEWFKQLPDSKLVNGENVDK